LILGCARNSGCQSRLGRKGSAVGERLALREMSSARDRLSQASPSLSRAEVEEVLEEVEPDARRRRSCRTRPDQAADGCRRPAHRSLVPAVRWDHPGGAPRRHPDLSLAVVLVHPRRPAFIRVTASSTTGRPGGPASGARRAAGLLPAGVDRSGRGVL